MLFDTTKRCNYSSYPLRIFTTTACCFIFSFAFSQARVSEAIVIVQYSIKKVPTVFDLYTADRKFVDSRIITSKKGKLKIDATELEPGEYIYTLYDKQPITGSILVPDKK